LYEPSRDWQRVTISSAVTGVTPSVQHTAIGVSPQRGSGMPKTATSTTAGWSMITFSSSAGQMLKPPEMIMSSLRSRT